uniref:Uncharacterized protein n=1 Tax=Strigamia maritima TaxID=126957 RepID=T1J986_STRMM
MRKHNSQLVKKTTARHCRSRCFRHSSMTSIAKYPNVVSSIALRFSLVDIGSKMSTLENNGKCSYLNAGV